jgi:hypothetical protein
LPWKPTVVVVAAQRGVNMLKKIVIGLLLVVVALAAIGMLLPGKVSIQRSTVIAAGPDVIVPLIDTARRWPQWMPWNEKKDPTVKQEFGGPDRGAGSYFTWTSEKLGSGKMEITKSEPQAGIEFKLFFEEQQQPAAGAIKLEKADAGTKATWTFEGDMGLNPIGRWMGVLFMDRMLGGDYEEGLASLKALAEKK